MSGTIARTAAVLALSALVFSGTAGVAGAQGTGSVTGLDPGAELSSGSGGSGSSSVGIGSGSESGGSADGGSSSADSGVDGSLGEVDSDVLLQTGLVVGSAALGSAGAAALGIDVNAIILQAITPLVDMFWSVVWSAAASTITVPTAS